MHGGQLVAAFAAVLILVGTTALADFPEPAKLPSQPELPDPLVMFSGERVKTKDDWTKNRRPELKALFQHYMYGYAPAAPCGTGCTAAWSASAIASWPAAVG